MEDYHIRSFYLGAVTHCYFKSDWIPGPCTSVARPFCSFTEIEQTIIGSEVEKSLLKGIIRLSSHEDAWPGHISDFYKV